MTGPDDGLYAAMLRRGITRRAFLQFSAAMAAALALPASYAPRIARALEAAPRLPVIWLRGQACAGNTTAFLRAFHPPIDQLMLELLSIDYHESIMAPAGSAAAKSRTDTMTKYPDGYIAVIEGSIPDGEDGAYCIVGGQAFRDIARDVSDGALATIGVGTCALDGGVSAAGGGATGATGAGSVASGRLISLPGCPLNVENLTATIVHYLTFGDWPPTDARNRPYFAYGSLIHNQCERRPHFEFGRFVQAWGDEGAQKGWCLYKMGCKGPEAYANCPTVGYTDGTSWPVRAGHGCVGCHMPGFWDAMSPMYRRLPPPLPLGPQLTVDHVGQLLVGAVIAGTAVHGGASYARDVWTKRGERRAALSAGEAAEAESAAAAAAAAEVAPAAAAASAGPVAPAAAAASAGPVAPAAAAASPGPVAPAAAAAPVAPPEAPAEASSEGPAVASEQRPPWPPVWPPIGPPASKPDGEPRDPSEGGGAP